jgi:hypothetical protein
MPRKFSRTDAVIAAQRAYQSHMTHDLMNSSTVGALLTTNLLLDRDIKAESHLLRQSIYQRNYSRRQIHYQPSQRQAISPTHSKISTNPSMNRTLTMSASITSFDTRTSSLSEQSSGMSTMPSLVCVRDFPTENMPLPGWQLHFLKDGADNYEPLREPDDYLYDQTLRRNDKGKALSWKSIQQVCIPAIMSFPRH